MKRPLSIALVLMLALTASACTPTPIVEEVESIPPIAETPPPLPERDVTAAGSTSAVCVDEVKEISGANDPPPTALGIDIDQVTLSEESRFLVATFDIESIGDLERMSAVPKPSLGSAEDNGQFTIKVRSAENPDAWTSFRT